MDSSAYSALIRELQPEVAADPCFLPYCFVKEAIAESTEKWRALHRFLHEQIQAFKMSDSQGRVPSALCDEELGHSLLAAHQFMAHTIASDKNPSPAINKSKALLEYFLDRHLSKDSIFVFAERPLDLAMLVCTLEGLLHGGASPAKQEGRIKSLAHAFFLELRKNIHKATPIERAAIVAYIWGAWLFARKTEGIRDQKRA
ncbi:MAG: hypothetical protein PHC61_18100 [Chitinivibrionales bacterium]|nr:hypothetical protein [Chitinivibrionales bacterium]